MCFERNVGCFVRGCLWPCMGLSCSLRRFLVIGIGLWCWVRYRRFCGPKNGVIGHFAILLHDEAGAIFRGSLSTEKPVRELKSWTEQALVQHDAAVHLGLFYFTRLEQGLTGQQVFLSRRWLIAGTHKTSQLVPAAL
jgi:hypothetical protein